MADLIAATGIVIWLLISGSFIKWFCHPWRCWGFGIHWEGPVFRIIWCGWFTIVHDIPKGWRGWYVSLYTD